MGVTHIVDEPIVVDIGNRVGGGGGGHQCDRRKGGLGTRSGQIRQGDIKTATRGGRQRSGIETHRHHLFYHRYRGTTAIQLLFSQLDREPCPTNGVTTLGKTAAKDT